MHLYKKKKDIFRKSTNLNAIQSSEIGHVNEPLVAKQKKSFIQLKLGFSRNGQESVSKKIRSDSKLKCIFKNYLKNNDRVKK